MYDHVRNELKNGRQAYVICPRIEEPDPDKQTAMTMKSVIAEAARLKKDVFQEWNLGVLHGKMTPAEKDKIMNDFKAHKIDVLVATSVVEVGVSVQNATNIIIEGAERFGLAQLHQLRGRVGRGAEQSYCVLMIGVKLSKDSKVRMETMVRTNNGFEIADVDLRLRGPGDMSGTQQSGVLDLLLADLSTDANILKEARITAQQILDDDFGLAKPEHFEVRKQVEKQKSHSLNWGRIS
jgi:ATP-dependent DNA helicase RecG